MSNDRYHIALDDDGLAGQWVDIVDVAAKSPKQFKALRSVPTDPAVLANMPEEDARAAGRQFLAMCVRAWNVSDPETGEPLPPPASPDLDPDCVPAIVTARITAEVKERFAEVANLAPRSKRA